MRGRSRLIRYGMVLGVAAALLALMLAASDQESGRGHRTGTAEEPAPLDPSESGTHLGLEESTPNGALEEVRATEDPQQPYVVWGEVRDPKGPIPDVTVSAWGTDAAKSIATATTDASGRYSLAVTLPVVMPTVVIEVGAEWRAPERVCADRQRVTVRADTSVRQDFLFDFGLTVAGTLVDELGKPVPGVCLAVVPQHALDRDAGGTELLPEIAETLAVGRSVSASNGDFEIHNVAAGLVRLVSLDHGWSVRSDPVIRVGAPPSFVSVSPVLSLDLEVRDIETHEPLERCGVRIAGTDATSALGRVGGRFRGQVARPLGRLRKNWGGYDVDLEVSAEGYEKAGSRAFVDEHWLIEARVDLTRSRAANATFLVRNADGSSFGGELAGVFRAWAPDASVWRTFAARCTTPGIFDCVLPAGRWWVSVWPRGAIAMTVPALDVTVPSSGRWQGEVRLPPYGRIRVALPTTVTPGEYWLSLASGRTRDVPSPWHPGTPATVLTDGSVTLESRDSEFPFVGAGEWSVDVRCSGRPVLRTRITVDPTRVVELTIENE